MLIPMIQEMAFMGVVRIVAMALFFPLLVQPTGAAAQDSVLTITPQDSVVARLYVAMLDRELEQVLPAIRSSFNLPESYRLGKYDYVYPNWGDEPEEEKEPVWLARAQAAEALSFAWRLPSSSSYRSPETLELMRKLLQDFNQTEARFSGRSPLETAQVLKSLIFACHNVQEALPETERNACRSTIEEGLQQLLDHPRSGESQETLAFCCALALGGVFTGEAGYTEAAAQAFQSAQGMFQASGAVLEEGDPDLYSAVLAVEQLFLYRWISQREELDPPLLASLRWITQFFTFRAVPLEGISARHWLHNGAILLRLLAPLTYAAGQEPDFAQLATRYLETFSQGEQSRFIFPCLATFLAAAQFHTVPQELTPLPYQPYSGIYQENDTYYFTIGRNYQTLIPLRSRLPLKGMQTWSYKGQPPLILPEFSIPSRAEGHGFLSSELDLSWRRPPEVRHSRLSPEIETLLLKQGELYTAYIFTTDTTVVIYRKTAGQAAVEWVGAQPQAARLKTVSEQLVTFQESDARIFLPNLTPSTPPAESAQRLRFAFNNDFCWFTFAGPQSAAIVRPVTQYIVFIHVQEGEQKHNLVINLSPEAFSQRLKFPGTEITVPHLPAWGSALME
jgi:hypothetical protein